MSVSGVTIIKNGMKLGYPFIEAVLSILDVCDEIIISEGYSEDGSDIILEEAFLCQPKVRIYHDRWQPCKSGREIARITDKAVSRASCDWIYYIQADEIVHESNHAVIRAIANSDINANSAAFSFLHFQGSWEHVIEKPSYIAAIRMFRNGRNILSHHDGWSFHGDVNPVLDCTSNCKPIYHYGWVFKENIREKKINRAMLYPDIPGYLRTIDDPWFPEPPEPNFFDSHPAVMKPLIGLNKYSPLGISA